MTGTIRYLELEVRDELREEITRAMGIARTMGGDYVLEFEGGYPPMYNDEQVAGLLKAVVVDLLGAEHIHTRKREMGAEDFEAFSSLAPGAMFSLGCLIEGDERRAHSPCFDVDERCLPIGAAILAEAALRLLRA